MTERVSLPRRRRVLNRLVAATLLAGLGAGTVGALLLQSSARSAALADARDRNLMLAEQYAVRLDARVESLIDKLQLVSTRREIGAVGAGAVEELRVVLRVTPTFDEMVLYDDDGLAVAAAASRFLAEPMDYPPRPELIADATLVDGAHVVEGDRDATSQLELAVAVENPPGRVVGVLVARASVELVTVALENSRAGDDPVAFLVDERGTVLVHRDRSRVVGDDRFPIDVVLAGADGAATIDQGGEPHLLAVADVERLDATVVVEQSEAVALAPVEERRRELVVILVAAMAAAMVAVIAAGELLLRPLRPLIDAVVRVGRGEREVRAGVSGYGEIGLLAGEVDRMAESLDRRGEQIAELRELSLLVGTLAERREVAGRVARGAATLVQADGCAVCKPPGAGPPAVEAIAGTRPEASGLEEAIAGAVRTKRPFRSLGPGDAQLLAVPLTGSDGEPLGALVVHRRSRPFDAEDEELLVAFASFASVAADNARRLELQHALIEQLQEAVDRRRDLIGTITHEFRTPLACIEGFSTALIDGWDGYRDEERRELVTRIEHHTEELDDLVGRFLDFTVTERGGLSAHVSTVALGAAVAQAVESLAPLFAERHIEVDVPEVPVQADPVLLRRTLTNLLSNAVKYSSAGSLVAVRARVDGTSARVEVVDEGVGLTAQEAALAFEPFWRAGSATTRTTRGTGLGLALVAEYVRVMSGSSGVTSEPGRGSTFFFTLPLTKVPTSRDGGGEGWTP